MTITEPIWTIIVGSLLPVVIAGITQVGASRKLKAQVAVVVAAIGALVTRATVADGSAVISTGLLVDIGFVYGPQLLAYYAFWKKVVNINARVFPDRGIG